MSKSTGGSSERSRKSKGKEDAAKKKNEEEEDPGFKMTPSNFLPDLINAKMEFDVFWKEKLDDSDERPYLDMIRVHEIIHVLQ